MLYPILLSVLYSIFNLWHYSPRAASVLSLIFSIYMIGYLHKLAALRKPICSLTTLNVFEKKSVKIALSELEPRRFEPGSADYFLSVYLSLTSVYQFST